MQSDEFILSDIENECVSVVLSSLGLEPWFRHCFFSALGYGSKVIFYGCLRHGSGFIFRVALTMDQASFIGVYEPWMRLHL